MLLRIVFTLLFTAGYAAGVNAQTWPTRPLRLLVSYPPGGATDISARVVAPKIGDSLGQQVVVDNRPGANGLIATAVVAKSAPDGHTIMLVDSAHGANPALYAKIPYDTLRDFTAIGMVARIPMLLIANTAFTAKSVKELVALARAQPGKLSYASAGTGSAIFLATELFKTATDVDIVQIAYKGGGPALAEVIGGQVPFMFLTVAASMPHVKGGRVSALGVSSLKRVAALPDVPTIAEAGVPGFEFHLWQALIAPAGVTPTVVARLNAELNAALAGADVKDRLSGLGADIAASTPAQANTFIREEVGRWRRILKADMQLDR